MEAKTLERLILDCRDELDDEVEPHLWSDEKLTDFLNEAVAEASIRARLLVQSGHPERCTITLVPGQAEYTLHPCVVIVRRAVLASDRNAPLTRTTSAALDGFRCDWRTSSGTPEYLVRDMNARTIVLSPIPDKAGTLELTVWRTPDDDELMDASDDEPVIDPMYHPHLFRWACFRALNQRDVEQQSLKDADRNLSMFENKFGPAPTAAQLQQLSIDQLVGSSACWF